MLLLKLSRFHGVLVINLFELIFSQLKNIVFFRHQIPGSGSGSEVKTTRIHKTAYFYCLFLVHTLCTVPYRQSCIVQRYDKCGFLVPVGYLYVFESGSGLMSLHSRFMLLISTNDRYKWSVFEADLASLMYSSVLN